MNNSYKKNYSLLEAAKNGSLGCVETLLKAGADKNYVDSDNHNALYLATENGYAEIVEILLQKGAKIELQREGDDSLLHIAARNGHEKTVEVRILHVFITYE